tara:strand:- start:1045 stop:1983 length:939 start_codon:yes stop_codon:yes gene_type:complete
MKKLNILLVGYGNMGKIHKRVIDNNNEVKLVGIVDRKFDTKLTTKNGIKHYKNINNVNFHDEKIDAVIISSTTSSHYELAKKIMDEGIPVFVEKPITTDNKELNNLINYSIKNNIVFRAGLIEIYNPVFKYIKELNLKDIISIHIFRHSQAVSKNRKLENVTYDLVLHDIGVILSLFKGKELKLISKNLHKKNNIVESADLMYRVGNSSLFLSSSRESQLKIRKWNIQTSDKLYLIDLIEKKIDIYESGKLNLKNSNLLSFKTNHSTVSFSNTSETAQIQFKSFIENIKNSNVDEPHLDLIKKSHLLVSQIK